MQLAPVLFALIAVCSAVPAAPRDALHQVLVTRFHESGLTLKEFSFADCAAASAPVHIPKLSITPDPIPLPGNITVSAMGNLTATLTAPLKLELTLEKKEGVWVKIPCVDNIGSCTYNDACALLDKIPLNKTTGQCPDPLPALKVPCRCPLPPFGLNVPALAIALPKLPPDVPKWLASGEIKVHAEMFMGGQQIMCVDVTVTLDAK
eukprot:m.319618 g.319618  ORF g.319618 m.319618 type:complete len:206 (-) comp23320_c0_seq1:109-726(-)